VPPYLSDFWEVGCLKILSIMNDLKLHPVTLPQSAIAFTDEGEIIDETWGPFSLPMKPCPFGLLNHFNAPPTIVPNREPHNSSVVSLHFRHYVGLPALVAGMIVGTDAIPGGVMLL
jgi:hypothetical protein